MITRAAVVALAASIIGLGASTPAAPAATPEPDVRVRSFDGYCDMTATYEWRLQNTGDRRRGVRGRIVWHGQGYYDSFQVRIKAGRGRWERISLHETERATITLRSQGEVILRAKMTGDICSKPNS